jgi:hypothetical protein
LAARYRKIYGRTTAMLALIFMAVSIMGYAGGMNMTSETDSSRMKNICAHNQLPVMRYQEDVLSKVHGDCLLLGVSSATSKESFDTESRCSLTMTVGCLSFHKT